MSLDLALGIARSGLASVQRAIAQASQNVSNADTPGYTRKTLPQQAANIAGMPLGVRSGAAQRDVDMALVAQLNAKRSAEAAAGLRADLLTTVEAAHGSANDGTSLGDIMATMRSAFTGLQASPGDTGQQRTVVEAAANLAGKLNSVSAAIQQTRQQAQDGIVSEVNSINAALRQVATFTNQIKVARVTGQSTAELEDQRDKVIASLSESIEVKAINQPDGSLVLIARGGISLPLDPNRDALSTSGAQVGAGAYYGAPGTLPGIMLGSVDITNQVAGGKLAEYVNLRDNTLPRYQAEVDTVATQLAYRFDAEGLRLFSDSAGNIPALGAYAGSGQVGFASTIQVNPAVLTQPSLVRDGTQAVVAVPGGPTAFTPNPSGGPAGFTTMIDRVLTYSLGDSAAAGSPWGAIPTTGLGPAGNLNSPFVAPTSLEDYATQVTAVQVGDRAAAAATKSQAATLREGLEARFSAQSGVDVDAEMAAMVQLQNAYAANAKVMGTVQTMWDALLATVR